MINSKSTKSEVIEVVREGGIISELEHLGISQNFIYMKGDIN